MSLEVGQLIEGKYRIIELIGEGGMGAVYLGENVRIQRKVAIKVLHGAYSSNVEVAQRFEREAQAAGRIGNDHILEVLDLGELPAGDRFMVMEHLEGETLAHRIKRLGRMAPHQIAPIAQQMLAGLAAAHAAGIVHRDLKPENIFILKEKAGKKDYVKIIDFGISKFQPLGGDAMKMTRTGVVMGTPYYMAPEQASGSRDADARSDLYAVGVMLYEAVTGRVPFDAPTFNQLMFQIVLSEPPPPQAAVPDLDPAFASVVSKGMARDVNHRFQTSVEFRAAIDAWLETGSAVTVPPAGALDPMVSGQQRTALLVNNAPDAAQAQPPAFAGPALNMTPGRGTAGNWATSQAEVVIPKKSAAPIVIAAALGGLVLIGGIGIAAVALLRGGEDTSATAASAVPPVLPPPVEPKPEPKAETPPPETPPEPKVEPAKDNAESEKSAAEQKTTAKTTPTSKTAPVRPSSGSSKASGSKAAATKSGSKSSAKSSSPTDFGY
jgi:eukaryotic-like serine/threonine-protein kinase